tara:strand:- start:1666 stop:2220 length:555 start_codon:yes stop_codon:yes gene_type:complete
MSALKAVGTGQVLATSTSAASSAAFNQQSDTLRVVAEGAGCHVAVAGNPTATTSNIYVGTSGGSEEISMGPVAAQRVVGLTKGATTTLDFPEGTGCPFAVGDFVSLTVQGTASTYNFTHKEITSIDTSSDVGGFFSTRIVVDNNSSSVSETFNTPYAELRRSLKVSVITNASTGKAFIQQVQVS